MRKSGKNMLYLTIIILSIAIFILIGVIINISNINKEIKKQQESKSLQLGETTSDNAYVDLQTHLSEVKIQEQKLISFKNDIATAITEMGIETSENASSATMSNNIKNINRHIYIGTTSSSYVASQTFDCSSITGYENLTIDNFEFIAKRLEVTQMDTYATVGTSKSDLTLRRSYDASTGILTLTYWGIGREYTSVALISDIYVKI